MRNATVSTARSSRLRKVTVVGVLVGAVALLAGACTPGGPAAANWKVKPSSIQVVRQNSFTTAGDRPYVIQVGFRSKLGVAGSSSAQIASQCSSGNLPAPDAAPAGTTYVVPPGSADVNFPAVQNLDIGDVLLGTAPLEIFGTLSFAMNRNVLPFITSCAVTDALNSALVPVLKDALDLLIAGSAVPPTQEQLVNLVVGNLNNFLAAAGSLIASIIEGLGNPDAIVGVGVQLLLPTSGAFAGILDAGFGLASLFNPGLANGFIPLPGLASSVKVKVGSLLPSSATFDFDGDAGHYIYTSTIG
ncbi:MAG: hypothetical protein ACOYOP_05385 [Microthrixaceae bacterium]